MCANDVAGCPVAQASLTSVMAVYTDVSDDDLARFLADYELGAALSFKGIAEGVENSNFFLHTERGNYILTLYEKRTRPEDLPFFLSLMEHVAGRGVVCPLPVRNKRGSALGHLAGRPAAIVTFLDGVSVKRPSALHCSALGTGLGMLHIATGDFSGQRANALTVSGWRPLIEAVGQRAETLAPGLFDDVMGELSTLEAGWPRDLPSGVIHADLFPNNVLFIGPAVSGLIDFYFAAHDAYAYDLAISIVAWCFEPDHLSLNATKAQALIAGYEKQRPLSVAERAALPLLCRGAALRFLATRLYDAFNTPAGALVKPLDPVEYWKKNRFFRRISDMAEIGA
jgi:homoserine kinase type II